MFWLLKCGIGAGDEHSGESAAAGAISGVAILRTATALARRILLAPPPLPALHVLYPQVMSTAGSRLPLGRFLVSLFYERQLLSHDESCSHPLHSQLFMLNLN